MTDMEMTQGTIILLLGTISVFAACALGLFLYAGNVVFVLILVVPVLGILAVYSAATDRDMSAFVRPLGRFGTSKYVGESCAASTLGGLAVMINSIFLLTFALILTDLFDADMFLITIILLVGTLLTAIGAYVAWREWEG